LFVGQHLWKHYFPDKSNNRYVQSDTTKACKRSDIMLPSEGARELMLTTYVNMKLQVSDFQCLELHNCTKWQGITQMSFPVARCYGCQPTWY